MATWFVALFAATTQPAALPAPPETRPARICRESERRTGSHIRSGRRCMTEEQWLAEDERRGRIPVSLRVTDGQDDAGQKRPQ